MEHASLSVHQKPIERTSEHSVMGVTMLNNCHTSQTEYLDRISSNVDLISASLDIFVALKISGCVGSVRGTD